MGATFTSAISTGADFAIDPSNGNVIYLSGRRVSSDAGASFTSIAGQYFPAFLPTSVVEQTLEPGTALQEALLAPTTEGTWDPLSVAPWLTPTVPWVRLDSDGSRTVTAKNLAPGNYSTDVVLNLSGEQARIPLRLTVVQRQAPLSRLSVRRVAGTGQVAFAGNGGPATQASFETFFTGMCFDPQGNLYVSTRDRIRRITPQGTITSFAGPASDGPTVSIGSIGTGTTGTGITIACTADGVYMISNADNEIRLLRYSGLNELFYKPTPGQVFVSFADLLATPNGQLYLNASSSIYRRDGNTWTRLLQSPSSISDIGSDRDGNILFNSSRQVSRLNQAGVVTLLGGLPNPTINFAGDNGPALQAAFGFSAAVIGDKDGNVLFGATNRVRAIYPSGIVQSIIGDGDLINPLPDGALADSGSLPTVNGFARDPNGVVYATLTNNTIVRFEAAAAPVPAISNGGVVSLASSQRRVAAGGIFSIYGTELASREALASGVPLATLLNGIQVRVNGVPVPLYYVGPLQINAQMPANQPAGTVRVQVVRDGVASVESTVEVVAASPDILRYGANRAVAINENGSLNGPGSSARPGQFLVVYLTGIGPVDQNVATGAAAPTNPLARATSAFNATIGGRPATVGYLGLAPGFVGLGQANLQVPAGLAAGDHELVITINGVESNRVVVTVGT
jgi:uncharacterized protein (TIGR03437 family)